MTDFEVIWEYQCSGSKWLEFDKDLTSFLNGLPCDSTDADKQIEGWNMRFDIQQMRQRNMDAGFTRNIRCAIRSPKDLEGAKKVWSYQGKPRKRWVSYPPELAIKLERQFGCFEHAEGESTDFDEKIEYSLNGQEVQVDLKAKCMTFLDSEEETEIKRTESNAGPPDSSDPPHPKSSPTSIRERNQRFQEEAEKKKARKSMADKKGVAGERKRSATKTKNIRGRRKKIQEIDHEDGLEDQSKEEKEMNSKENGETELIVSRVEIEKEKKDGKVIVKRKKLEEETMKRKKLEEEHNAKAEKEKVGERGGKEGKEDEEMIIERNELEAENMRTEEEDEEIIERNGLEAEKMRIEEDDDLQDGQVEEKEETGQQPMREGPEVDFECRELLGKVHVYVDGNSDLSYDVMLNQTNIQQNNNKFYLMQVLQSNVGPDCWVWFRWGRVGLRGQSSLTPFGSDLDKCLAMFSKKFHDKTRNDFLSSKTNFQKMPGKYDLIRIDYTRKIVKTTTSEKILTNGNDQNIGSEHITIAAEKNQMDGRVKSLMEAICDLKALERDARKLDYDFKRIPLGKITKEQIHAGYEALTRIEHHIKEGKFGYDFTEAVNAYYTRIPHSFGMRTPPMIRTMEEMKREIELLELLTGIEITVAEIAGDPLERHYARLKWELVPLENDNEYFKMVEEYLLKTHGPTHDKYRLQLRNVFELRQKENTDPGKAFREELGNSKLLWHGSRLANWYSILAHGLRIAPPEAPVTGYMFGKGAYFADVSTKSANYSLSDPDRPGYLLLSEVALGSVLDLRDADDQIHCKLPEGKHSVRGVGRFVPHPDGNKTIDAHIEVPCGKPTEIELSDKGSTSLIYNEFVVYNLNQIRERFLVEVEYKFEFEL